MTDVLTPRSVLTTGASRPMMVVDDAHVTYRVFASGKRLSSQDNLLSLRMMRGGRELHTVPAVRGITFTAVEGETIGVVGHNGSGKSTLLRAMSGLIPTSEGSIWARERPVLLGVNAALVPELSGENNIKLGLLAMGFTPAEAAAHVDEIAEFAELNEFIHHPMRTYSSGMGARLRFAIASAKAHSILLIDEALAVGDRRFKAKSDRRIRELRDTAGLVMIVSHSVNSLRDTCSRVLWVHKGELREDGPADEVVANYVAWTKSSKASSVGAAAVSRTKSADARKPRTERSSSKVTPSAHAEPSAIHELFAAATESATTPSRVDSHSELYAPAGDGAQTVPQIIPVAKGDARDAARRDRHRRVARERTKRRVIAIGIAAGALLVAVGTGAAVAILSNQAPPVRTSSSDERRAPTSTELELPEVTSFVAASPTAVCESNQGDASVSLSWNVDHVVQLSIAGAPTEVDAIAVSPTVDLPLIANGYVMPFPCSAESQVYTLTAQGVDGSRLSSAVAITREMSPSPAPTPVPNQPAPNRPAPNVPTQPDPVTPVVPDPVVPVDPPPVEPEPSSPPAEPEPTTPPVEPEPTLPVEPVPET